MNKFCLAIFLQLAFVSAAFALGLDEAKSKGLVGESPSGYLELVSPSAPPEAQALLSDINSKRRQEYQGIAQKNGTSLSAVEELAGKKAIEKTASGNFVKIDGSWQRK